jgi:hypothetical protein
MIALKKGADMAYDVSTEVNIKKRGTVDTLYMVGVADYNYSSETDGAFLT